MEKICNHCYENKSITDFSKNTTGKFGVCSTCKKCRAIYERKYKSNRQKYIKDYQKKYNDSKNGKKAIRKYRKNNPEIIKSESKLTNLFLRGDITNDDFICAICGKQPIEKHHENYDLPFVFIPLCVSHHREIQRKEV